jgi:hypothetical protein
MAAMEAAAAAGQAGPGPIPAPRPELDESVSPVAGRRFTRA